MLHRRPSLTATYEWCFSGDPALEQPPEDLPDGASDEDRATWSKAVLAHAKRIQVARETGSWASVTRPGEQPTRFLIRPVHGKVVRRITDLRAAGKIGDAETRALVAQVAIRDVLSDEFDVRLVEHPTFGQIVPDEIIAELDAIAPAIVSELADEVLRRASSPGPLS